MQAMLPEGFPISQFYLLSRLQLVFQRPYKCYTFE